MSVKNKSKRTILVERVRIARTWKEKALGLLQYDKPEVLLLRTRFGIHTFGMKYAIDVIVLNKENTVVKTRRSLPPNNIFIWNPRHDTVLELPEGIIEKTHTKVGDRIEIEERK